MMRNGNDPSRSLPVVPSEDAMKVMMLLDSEGPDCDFEIVKRDGRIVNMRVTRELRKELARGAGVPLREVP